MPNKRRIPWWRSITYRLLIFGIIMSIVPLAVLGYFNVRATRANLEQTILNHTQITASRLAADLENLIGGQLAQVAAVARASGGALVAGSREQQEGILFGLLRQASYLEEISLVGSNGQELARVSRRQVIGNDLRDLSGSATFLHLKTRDQNWAESFLDSYGQVRVKRIIPINSQVTGDFQAGLILELSLRGLVDQISERQPEQQGRIFVVDAAGKLVGHQDFSQVLRRTDVRQSLAVQDFLHGVNPETSKPQYRYTSYDGREVLGVFAPVNQLDWAVIQEVPLEEAFASIDRLVGRMLFVGLALIFLVTLTSVCFGVRFSDSLNDLTRAVDQIRNGNLNQRITLRSKDELGSLAETLDTMRQELRTRRQQEQALRQAEKLSSLGLLASGVAHELNNPLGIISAYAEDLEEQLNEGPAKKILADGLIQDYILVILKQVKRCKEITDNLLNFTYQSSRESSETNLGEAVQGTLKLVKYRLEQKKIITNVEIADHIPPIRGDLGEIQQVLLNVITNALDALHVGGKLEINALAEEETVRLKVIDNGCGIKEQDLERICDPFFTTKEPGKGTGLGLSICYGIMQQLGGDLQVESVQGEGTRVTLAFPVAKGRDNAGQDPGGR